MTQAEQLKRGMQLAMLLTQQVCQDKRTHKMVQDGRLSAATMLYEWACEVDETVVNVRIPVQA